MLFLGAAILSIVTTWLWIRAATRLGLLDTPNPLIPQHQKPTAHMGGVAVAAAAYGTIGLAALLPPSWFGSLRPVGLPLVVFLASASFLLLGMLDDVLRLSARSKFVGQIVIAAAVVAGGVAYPFFGWEWIDRAIAVILILAAVNAVNLTDVCDGLVAGLSAIALLFVAIIQPELGHWTLAAAGACVGFLVFNAPPARVFLGDAGSHWLGFLLVAALLAMKPTDPPLLHAARMALIAGVFLFELALLVVARALRGIPFWQGSPDHFALRLQAAGWSRPATVGFAWAMGAALATLAFLLPGFGAPQRLSILAAVLTAAAAAHLILLFTTNPTSNPSRPARTEPRRLLWIHQNFVSDRQAGNSRAVHLVAALLEQGWAVDVVTTQTGYLDEESRGAQPPTRLEREEGLTIHRLSARGSVHRRGLSWLSFCAKALMYVGHFRRVDVVYASTPPLPQVLLAALVALVRRAPLVLEVRDLWPLFLERIGVVRSPLALLVMEGIEAFAYRTARRCIAVSPAFRPYLAEMGIPAQACTVAPTGLGTPHLDSSEAAEWRRANRLERSFLVLYAGSFNESYDVERMLQAAERTAERDPRIQWVFAGGGRGKRRIEEAAGRLPNVRYLGAVEKDRLWPILMSADVGIVSLGPHPVLKLVIPGKLFDYCSAKLPVISTIDGMTGALVRLAGAGRVIAEPTSERLAEAVCEFAAMDEDARRAYGRQGHAWMSVHMSSASSARAMARVVDDAQRRHAGHSQWTHLAAAAGGAIVDVATRRSQRAGELLLAADLSSRCETSLAAWLDGGRPRVEETPLGIPALLTARGEVVRPVL